MNFLNDEFNFSFQENDQEERRVWSVRQKSINTEIPYEAPRKGFS